MSNKVVMQTLHEYYTELGLAFFSKAQYTIPAGNTVYSLGIVPTSKNLFMADRIIECHSDNQDIDITVELYEDATVSDNGTELDIYNNNRNKSDGTAFKNYKNPTVTDEGTLLPRGRTIKGTKDQIVSSGDRDPYLMGKGKNYLLKITNNAVNAVVVDIFWDWYEDGDF